MVSQLKIFDAHFHIIDPTFPLTENQEFLPEAFTAKDYAVWMKKLGIFGGALASGSFQVFDTSYLEAALKKIYQENPDGLLFRTDLPSTRAKRPFSPNDITLITDNFTHDAAEKILWKNAYDFYSVKKEK